MLHVFLLFALFLPMAVPAPLPPVTPRSDMLGVADAYLQSDMAWNAGVRWQRVLFYWDAIQPEWNGQSNPNRFVSDAVIKHELDRGSKMVGIIGNPPSWATGEGSVPKNLNLAVDDPNNNWARITRQLAQTYAGRIDTWIVWNEPDIRPGQAGSTWNGTDAEYWQLLKTAYKAIKAANPKAAVAIAGTTYWADARDGRKLFFERVLEVGARDPEAKANNFFFDVVPYHIYSSPYKVYEVAKAYQEIMAKFGLSKPLWLTETNVVPADDPHATVPRAGARGSLEEQASFVIQTVALARAAGVDKVQLYKMQDGPIEGGEPYGLVRNDRSPRPAYVALQTAAKYLLADGKVTYVARDGVAHVVIDNGRQRTTVAWAMNPTATNARVPQMGTKAVAVDKYGVEHPLQPSTSSAFHDVRLAPATANTAGNANDYIIGGDPMIVVEDGIGDPIDGSPSSIYYGVTGFNVFGARLDYFRRRGELKTFGYPISRPFKLLGHQVQLFQRTAIETRPDGSIGTLNVLDDELLPYTRFNGAVIPARDADLTKSAPTPGSRDYSAAILRWLAEVAPDQHEGLDVGFKRTFDNTVSFETAFPGGKGDRQLLPGLNMELWGVPTSRPAFDPNNRDFVYQRFQRGVMHYDGKTGETQGLLLAAYLKAILTGADLPADLAAQAQDSRLFKQYDPRAPGGIARPAQLADSDLTNAFEREPLAR